MNALRILLLLVALAGPVSAADPLPQLEFVAPEALQNLATQLAQTDHAARRELVASLGLSDPGPPIRVILAPNGSLEARRAPSWSLGYAISPASLVVLLVDRVPAYPDHSLEQVLRHEIAHVLIHRAAGGQPIPRWLDEGLAIYWAREWGIDDRGRVWLATVRHDTLALDRLNQDFQAGPTGAGRAYALATAFVRDLIAQQGPQVGARILQRVRSGAPFPLAFEQATGLTLGSAEAEFWSRLDFWNRWVPFLTSSTTLWLLITGLALVAFKRRRDLDRAQIARWEAEETRVLLAEETSDRWVN